MEQRLVCDTVRDLLPMYIDHMTSEASDESIKEHIAGCGECRAVLEQMKQPVKTETAEEVKDFKKFMKKSRMSLFYWTMGAAAVIAAVTCFIVNLAVDKKLSWFYIVCAGLVTAYFPAYICIISRKRRFEKTLAALSICTIVLVGTVQMALYYLMNKGEIWFWDIGLPVTALWLLIVWIGAAVHILFKVNFMISLAAISFLAVPGNILTHLLTGDYQEIGDIYAHFVSDGMANVFAAVVLLMTGIAFQLKKGKKKEKDGEQLFS